MGAGSAMVTDLSSRLAVAVKVEVDTDSSHAGEGGETLLLVVAIARGPVSVGADNKGLLTFLQRGVDGAEDMLPGHQFKADILGCIAIVLADFRENGLGILHAGIEENVNLEAFTYLLF